MKNLIALHAAQLNKTGTPFTHSMVQKILISKGEKIDTKSTRIGDYYIHDSIKNEWFRTNDIIGMQVIKLSNVKEFLTMLTGFQPIPDNEWMEIEEEIDNDVYGY